MTVSARAAVLQSVFPSTSDSYSSPTPQATPLIGQESFGQSQGPETHDNTDPGDTALENVRWERAWHTATSFLFERLQAHGQSTSVKGCPKDVRLAISYLRSQDSLGWRLRKNIRAEDLLWWYSQTVQEIFLKSYGPIILKHCLRLTQNASAWLELRSRLITYKACFLSPFEQFVMPIITPGDRSHLKLLEDAYSALVTHLLMDRIRQPLIRLSIEQTRIALQSIDAQTLMSENSMDGIETSVQQEAQLILEQTFSDLIKGGFPRESMERLFAKALDSVLKSHVVDSCSKRWESPSPLANELRQWVSEPFAALARSILKVVRLSSDANDLEVGLSKGDVTTWQQTALRELGLLRLRELFDIIVEWDSGSRGGIEDLKHFITSPQARMHVVNHFNETLSYRLLHPGASTAEILQMYIRIMRAFAVLDHRFVILDRVSRPIRRYLRDREDTIRIIVAGLLSDPGNPESSPDALGELAIELHNLDEITNLDGDDEFDWDDMNWVPNPADADADYKNSKDLDIIGQLLTLFETKDTVVREFQNILGERLLSPESDYSREIRVLELLKSRFGESSLQGCEVMIKDIFDSGRTDLLIKKEQNILQESEDQPSFYAKILSRFFWPSLRDDEFRVPPQVQALQDRYSHGFEEHKMQRKLAWLPSLGQVTVELQLEDRTITELVAPWQASVIYAFHEEESDAVEGSGGQESPEKTTSQLAEALDMDEDLVANALSFWVSKLVLYQPQPGSYRVLETLPTETALLDSAADEQEVSANIVAAAHSASAAAAATAASAVRTDEELAEEKMEVLWQYVVGMLTNQGAMPLQQMVMMLNFVAPGGFTHSQEDFRRFLQRKVEDGKLQMAGASFKMPKR